MGNPADEGTDIVLFSTGSIDVKIPSYLSPLANPVERRKLLLSMLDAVYGDAKKTKSIIAIKPKPPFKPVFQVAASREGSICIMNEPLEGSSLFLVETGEGRTPRPEEAVQDILQV